MRQGKSGANPALSRNRESTARWRVGSPVATTSRPIGPAAESGTPALEDPVDLTRPTTRPDATDPARPDPEVVAFLYARLGEDGLGHHLRRAGNPGRDRARDRRAAALVDEVLADLAHGRAVETWIVDVLLQAYREHPDFRAEWLGRTRTSLR